MQRRARGPAQLVFVGCLVATAAKGVRPARLAGRVDVGGCDRCRAGVGADLVWLLADADDWPKELYGKLGLDPIGSCWQYTKPPPDRTYR